MKGAMELNRLFLKFVWLCQVDIHESFREENAKFTFLGIIWESKIQNFNTYDATSGIYWVYYKSPVLSYLEVGTNAAE